MPLTGPLDRLRRVAANMADLASPTGRAQRDVARGIIREAKVQLRAEFSSGTGPDGAAWARTARGAQALDSKRITPTIAGIPVAGGAAFRSHIPWLEAQQEGHTFPARRSGGGQRLRYDEQMRLVSAARAARTERSLARRIEKASKGRWWQGLKASLLRSRAAAKRLASIDRKVSTLIEKTTREIVTRAHAVGARVLPARPIVPEGALPPAWLAVIERGLVGALGRWYARGK